MAGFFDNILADPSTAQGMQNAGTFGGLQALGAALAAAGAMRPVGQPGPTIGDAFSAFGAGRQNGLLGAMKTQEMQRTMGRESAWRDAATGAPTTPEGMRLYSSIPEKNRAAIFAMGPEQGLKAWSAILSQRPVSASPGHVIQNPDGTTTRIPYTPEDFAFRAAGASRQSVTNINQAPEGVPQVGTVPPHYMLTKLAGGGWGMQPIPGGEADVNLKKAADAKRVEDANKGRAGDVVVQDLDRALALHAKSSMLPTAGLGATTAAQIPGTAASDINQLLDSAKSGISFNALTEMRKASPTGAALGSVQVRELEMLQAALGSLNQAQSPAQFQQNITRARNLFLDIVHGPGNGPARIPDGITATGPGGRGTASPSPPSGATMRWNPASGKVEPVR